MTWNKLEHRISTFTINGVPIATAQLPFSGNISCMEVSVDEENALIAVSSCSENGDICDNFGDSILNENRTNDLALGSDENSANNSLAIPVPSICLLNLHTLKVFHTLKLGEGQDIIAVALNKDNTNLLVSTADRQLIIFIDPTLSLKVVNHILKLGWEGEGLSPLTK